MNYYASRLSRKKKISAFIQEHTRSDLNFSTFNSPPGMNSSASRAGYRVGLAVGGGLNTAKKVGGFAKRNPLKAAAIGGGGYLAYKGAKAGLRKVGRMMGMGKKKNKLQSARERIARRLS